MTQLLDRSEQKKENREALKKESCLHNEVKAIPEAVEQDCSPDKLLECVYGDGDDEDEYINYSLDVQHVTQFDRIEWNKNGLRGDAPPNKNFSMWGSLANCETSVSTSGRGEINSWDLLFCDGSSHGDVAQNCGIEQLVGLFDASPETSCAGSDRLTFRSEVPVQMPDLSQTACSKASEVVSSVQAEPAKLASLEKACPNWRENVEFAMKQTDKDAIASALQQVRVNRRQMVDFKRRILETWEAKDAALEVFELSLEASIERLSSVRWRGQVAKSYDDRVALPVTEEGEKVGATAFDMSPET